MELNPTTHERLTDRTARTGVGLQRRAAVDGEPARPRPQQPDRIVALQAEVAVLEAEVEKREQQLQQVVDRYEALLAEQTRAHRESAVGGFTWTGSGADDATDESGGPGLVGRLQALLEPT